MPFAPYVVRGSNTEKVRVQILPAFRKILPLPKTPLGDIRIGSLII